MKAFKGKFYVYLCRSSSSNVNFIILFSGLTWLSISHNDSGWRAVSNKNWIKNKAALPSRKSQIFKSF